MSSRPHRDTIEQVVAAKKSRGEGPKGEPPPIRAKVKGEGKVAESEWKERLFDYRAHWNAIGQIEGWLERLEGKGYAVEDVSLVHMGECRVLVLAKVRRGIESAY